MGRFLASLGAFGIILVVLWIIFFPWVTIWAVNVLFPAAAIGYTFKTWCAALILITVFGKTSVEVKR